MKVSNYIEDNGGFFTHLTGGLFTPEQLEELDDILIIKFGDLPTIKNIFKPDRMVKYISSLYSDKWELLLKMDFSEIDLLTSEELKIVTKTDEKTDSNKSNTDVSKVAGYNADIMLPENERENIGIDSLGRLVDVVQTHSKQNINNVWGGLNDVDKVNIMNIITQDTINEITIKIY